MKPTLLTLFGILTLTTTLIADRPNILFITVDDMSCDSIGAFGCELKGTTPHIDRLARQSLRFEYAHVVVGNCMPSRNCMLSGRYPHNNRVEGFYPVKDKDYPVLCDLMKEAGYFTAIRGKVSHSTPYHPYEWDLVLENPEGGREHPKDVESYHRSTAAGIEAARKAGKPFCLLVNVSDPHKPFYATGKKGEKVNDPHKPSRIFTAEEVPVPGFLFDDPDVRKELAQYYSTVRRADDCVGQILKALRESGAAKNTIIVFLSDHGMPLPFAKTAVYHHSTWTPLIVKWPGVTKADSIDRHHMVSGVDILPTFLDFAGIQHPADMDGRSFAPIVRGEKQDNRDYVVKEYNENSGGGRHPMRSVQSRRFCYIFNPWADGQRVFKTATTGTMTYRRMKTLAASDPAIAARLDLFDHRVREEFYDVVNDPDCLHNLLNDPTVAGELEKHRRMLESWMKRTGDHVLKVFQQRDNEAVVQAYMQQIEEESADRRKQRRKQPKSKKRSARLIKLETPEKLSAGKPAIVRIPHTVPAKLGTQKLHVTLKVGKALTRFERKVVEVKGTSVAEVSFSIPTDVPDNTIGFAVFIGEDYPKNLQHLATKAIRLK